MSRWSLEILAGWTETWIYIDDDDDEAGDEDDDADDDDDAALLWRWC